MRDVRLANARAATSSRNVLRWRMVENKMGREMWRQAAYQDRTRTRRKRPSISEGFRSLIKFLSFCARALASPDGELDETLAGHDSDQQWEWMTEVAVTSLPQQLHHCINSSNSSSSKCFSISRPINSSGSSSVRSLSVKRKSLLLEHVYLLSFTFPLPTSSQERML